MHWYKLSDVRDKFPVSFVSLKSVSRIMPDHLMYSHKTWRMGAERANEDPIKFWRECGSWIEHTELCFYRGQSFCTVSRLKSRQTAWGPSGNWLILWGRGETMFPTSPSYKNDNGGEVTTLGIYGADTPNVVTTCLHAPHHWTVWYVGGAVCSYVCWCCFMSTWFYHSVACLPGVAGTFWRDIWL